MDLADRHEELEALLVVPRPPGCGALGGGALGATAAHLSQDTVAKLQVTGLWGLPGRVWGMGPWGPQQHTRPLHDACPGCGVRPRCLWGVKWGAEM